MQLNTINNIFEQIKNYLTADSYYFKPLELDKVQLKLELLKREINEIYASHTYIVGEKNV